ncbi:McrC family protein [Butyrivibrio sp. MB2005]|uniref:McrC family protein n=1 Tax=Butyrivibrio sp. MB2005 TaxID=1280678 RepID=UPI000420AD50|nr:McrC family protein [Butyrivibrio sp. MB2005]
MQRLVEVKEFDSIIRESEYSDDYNFKSLSETEFSWVMDFAKEYTSMEEGDSDALEFMRIGYKKPYGDVITLKNYVGLIQLKNGFQIQVLPKITFDSGDDAGNERTKKVFLKMLRSMKDFPGKIFNEASLKVSKMNLYELFINMYLQEVRQLLKRGIRSSYIETEDNLRFYKGKLLVNQHIKANVAHRERFYVSYEEFHPNRPENRLIKSTLLKLQKISSSAENSKEIRQMLTHFEMVEPSSNYEKDFSKVVIDRNTKDYDMLMKWSKVFLLNRSFTTFSGDTTSRALLFPMEKVYESYVAREMKKAFMPDGWLVSSQDHGYYLFDEPRSQFALRPDIVMKRGDRTIVMDTKWKRLMDNDYLNYGISQADMYQMYAYSKKYETPEIWLLYPETEEMRDHKPIEYVSMDPSMETHVHVHFVDLEHIEDNLQLLKEKISIEVGNDGV